MAQKISSKKEKNNHKLRIFPFLGQCRLGFEIVSG